MICEPCAYEADLVKNGERTHAHFRAIAEQWADWGAERSPMGHAACAGCDCQHKPVGAHIGAPRD
jgi:hypothetical protein